MVKYSLEIKQSAQKELDALGDPPFTRIITSPVARDGPEDSGAGR